MPLHDAAGMDKALEREVDAADRRHSRIEWVDVLLYRTMAALSVFFLLAYIIIIWYVC
jgi:hypothetical protein